MSLSIRSATWDASGRAVEIRGSKYGADAYQAIWRADANGVNAVRTLPNFSPRGNFFLADYEAALSGDVSYYGETSSGKSDSREATGTPSSRPLISSVTDPTRAITIEAIRTLDTGREWGTQVIDLIGASAPRVIYRPPLARTVAYTTLHETLESARGLEAVLERGSTYLLRMPEYPAGVYFVPLSAHVAPLTIAGARTTFCVAIEAREVARPNGPLRTIAGHTYGDSYGVALTYQEDLRIHPTYSDRLEGNR